MQFVVLRMDGQATKYLTIDVFKLVRVLAVGWP